MITSKETPKSQKGHKVRLPCFLQILCLSKKTRCHLILSFLNLAQVVIPFPNGSRYYKEQYKYLRNDLRQAISTYYLSDLQEFRFSCKNPTISDPGVPPIVPLFFGMVPLNKRFRVGQRCSFVYAGNLDARPRSAQLSICFLAFSSTALRFATWANCTKCLPSSCFHGLAHSGQL